VLEGIFMSQGYRYGEEGFAKDRQVEFRGYADKLFPRPIEPFMNSDHPFLGYP
jgi:hypothetical protein